MNAALMVRACALALALALAAASAQAGRSCEARQPLSASVQQSLDLAHRTMLQLDASGADVVLLARAGQDLSRYRLRWSHVGWAYRDADGWRVVHKLNQCGTARGDLFRQGLAEFFLDDPHEYRAAFAVPTPAVQRALRPLLADDRRAGQLHTADYSMVAYPWAQRYQQSNQWAIETLALSQLLPAAGGAAGHAGSPTPADPDREVAQSWLRVKGYQPDALRLGALTRLGARMTAANVAFDDHPSEKRFADRIETIAADSVFAWLARAQLAEPPREIR